MRGESKRPRVSRVTPRPLKGFRSWRSTQPRQVLTDQREPLVTECIFALCIAPSFREECGMKRPGQFIRKVIVTWSGVKVNTRFKALNPRLAPGTRKLGLLRQCILARSRGKRARTRPLGHSCPFPLNAGSPQRCKRTKIRRPGGRGGRSRQDAGANRKANVL